LTAAYDLRLAGYPMTVFEAEPEPGGMLRYGITPYRLPRDVLDAEIEVLTRAGVEIRTGCRLGGDLDLDRLLGDGFAAVLLAVGAQRGRQLAIPGEAELAAVEDALAFLRRVNGGDRTRIEGRVVVVGGGSTAVEAARTARRLGAQSVEILYRRSREELLAAAEEIKDAEAEGVRFRFLVAPVRAAAEGGRLVGLECVQVGLGEPDASGRRRPIHIPGSEFLVPADRVLAAVGQEADLTFVPPQVITRMTEKGRLLADPDTVMTRLFGVFAAGDAVTGPATVIEAIAAGHRAAESIRHYVEDGRPGLRDEVAERPERRAAVEYGLPDARPVEAMRIRPRQRRPRPGREFHEVERAFTANEAVAEARRCLRCGPCGECRLCAPSCGRRHVMVRVAQGDGAAAGASVLLRVPSTVALGLSARRPAAGRLLPSAAARTLADIGPAEGLAVDVLPLRIHVRPELCRSCGRCVDVCPFGAIQLTDVDGALSPAALAPALCRGCHLCTAVCPTGAAASALSPALSPDWWGLRFAGGCGGAETGDGPCVVLACQRRAGALEPVLAASPVPVEVVRLRCVGQVQAGTLVDLHRRGARHVLVAGCHAGRCRFGEGARLAAGEVERAAAVLGLLGRDAGTLTADWSANRAEDPLDRPLTALLADLGAASPGPPPGQPVEIGR
jgi:NADPH-dependent glutamate synthase beta subunit-like oxidoreductase/coenzyme F420-reducing hydrogenase delta subunit/NAD-dependent dihydropyrimidine dehydrogenase PreA subunit